MHLNNHHSVRGLHHLALRCSDSEQTRLFYEGFLGLEFSAAIQISMTQTDRPCEALHTFFRLGDGSFLAFFEVPGMPFEFKAQHDFDLHVALEVSPEVLSLVRRRAIESGKECRGPSDHGFVESIYLRDPDGYVVELTAKLDGHDDATDPRQNNARDVLARWVTQGERLKVK